MSVTLEIKTKNYVDDLLSIKKSLSHMETIVEQYNGHVLSEPETKFGWTFFKLAFKPNLQTGIEEKFAKFMIDFFQSRGSTAIINAND